MAWFLFILLAALLAWAGVTFNRAVRLRNQVKEAWADIDVQLQRRYQLVPNLVEGFPSGIIARLFGFRLAAFFEIELASQRQAPVINLDKKIAPV